jgi:hypothetical protein
MLGIGGVFPPIGLLGHFEMIYIRLAKNGLIIKWEGVLGERHLGGKAI